MKKINVVSNQLRKFVFKIKCRKLNQKEEIKWKHEVGRKQKHYKFINTMTKYLENILKIEKH